jgi:hypothetical protein
MHQKMKRNDKKPFFFSGKSDRRSFGTAIEEFLELFVFGIKCQTIQSKGEKYNNKNMTNEESLWQFQIDRDCFKLTRIVLYDSTFCQIVVSELTILELPPKELVIN